MAGAKELVIKVLPAKIANDFIKKHHYSRKVVPNSNLHFGVFLRGGLHGVMSFGSSLDKRKTIRLVSGTGWNEFIELNRMAFDEALPKNSESRAIAIAIKLIKKNAPHIKWIVSFADGTQCGDGTIYRASGFLLTNIKKNISIKTDKLGEKFNRVTFSAHRPNEMEKFKKMKLLSGFQLRYIYFIDKTMQKNLTCPILPFSEIENAGAKMYKGKKLI